MHGVAGEKHASLRVSVCDDASPRPDAQTLPFHVDRMTYRPPQQSNPVDALWHLLAASIHDHEPPQVVHRIDWANIGPKPMTVDCEEHHSRFSAAVSQQIWSPKEQ